MPIVYAKETYARVIDEIRPLLVEHWQELAVYKDIPLDPDWKLYEHLDGAGELIIYTARLDGALIGYSIFSIHRRHPHYAKLSYALNDIIWIHPDHRHQGFGRNFRDFWDKQLYALGMRLVVIDTKVSHPDLMFLLKNGGYTTRSAGLEKRLDLWQSEVSER
jgi:GNAT superfamily N-acetyltransferase